MTPTFSQSPFLSGSSALQNRASRRPGTAHREVAGSSLSKKGRQAVECRKTEGLGIMVKAVSTVSPFRVTKMYEGLWHQRGRSLYAWFHAIGTLLTLGAISAAYAGILIG
jgi:hypothetical protein